MAEEKIHKVAGWWACNHDAGSVAIVEVTAARKGKMQTRRKVRSGTNLRPPTA
jgi:hypothetical protein